MLSLCFLFIIPRIIVYGIPDKSSPEVRAPVPSHLGQNHVPCPDVQVNAAGM